MIVRTVGWWRQRQIAMLAIIITMRRLNLDRRLNFDPCSKWLASRAPMAEDCADCGLADCGLECAGEFAVYAWRIA
eukprot:2581006-Alexandrium_andersonii.AAC.1